MSLSYGLCLRLLLFQIYFKCKFLNRLKHRGAISDVSLCVVDKSLFLLFFGNFTTERVDKEQASENFKGNR